MELIRVYPENTDALDRFLLEDEDIPQVVDHEIARDPAIINERGCVNRKLLVKLL
jgi:hypothetical protein